MKTIKANRDLLSQLVNGRLNIINWDVHYLFAEGRISVNDALNYMRA